MKKKIILITIIGLFLMMLPLMAGAEIVDSGTCGDNLTWILDNEGLLTISGTGEMRDYEWLENHPTCPWWNYMDLVKIVIIQDGITRIGNYSFNLCDNLISITIPEGVTSIGSYAFCGCPCLTSISIPESVISIGESAFVGCTSLSTVTIPENVTCIDNSVFRGCTGLTNIVLPENIISIGDSAFSSCTSLTSITIPENVTYIGYQSFLACNGLKSITIPQRVTRIDENAFAFCRGLLRVNISSSVISIEPSVFVGCNNLSSIVVQSANCYAYQWALNNGYSNILFVNTTDILYNITEGTPVGEQVNLDFSIVRANHNETRGTIHSLTCQNLNNNMVRFVLQFSVPEGLNINIYNDYNGEVLLYVTPYKCIFPEIGSFTFDVSIYALNSLTAINVVFRDYNQIYGSDSYFLGVYFEPNERNSFSYNLTDGNPIGNPMDLEYYSSFANPNETRGTIHSLTRQSLDNNHTRFVLQYTVPEGLRYNIFNPPNGDILLYVSPYEVTCSKKSTLVFDVSNTALEKMPSITIVFRDYKQLYGDSSFYFMLNFDPNKIKLSSLVLYLPSMLTTIEDEAFENLACEAVIVPNGCISIGSHAFRNCKNLKYIRVPANIEIAPDAFEGCDNIVIDRVTE